MKFTLILILFINILYTSIFSQTKKSIKALYTTENIKVDGFLNEVIWNKAEKSSDFIQFEPLNGAKASEKTDVMILYDNSAVYIGAMLYDKSKDSIYKELGKRDNAEVNSDLFMVGINPYNDGLNVVGFMVTAAGVQIDIKYNNDNEDFSWNAVWFSNIQILDSGWSVEMKIPFSALRFPKKTVQEWGFNALRQVRRNRELSSWNFVDKKMNSVTKQYGIITGIENIKPPLRLSATPYMSYYLQHNEQQQLNYRINGGLDVKYGINESFTLDMTLIPDFGQVKSDDKILNLTPFETFYGENRPFFTEGTELFNKGNIFYSRRIGGEPLNYNTVNENLAQGEKIKFNPAETKMINATKFSGRTKNGLGLGFFNAMTNKTDAIIIDSVGNEFKVETQPFTNYNMIVLDQSLRNNSYVSIINTNVYNNILLSDVSGTVFNFNDKTQTYALGGNFLLNNRKYNEISTSGKKYTIGVGKVSGNFKYGYDATAIDKEYTQIDMGYLKNNNETNHNLSVEYNLYKPFWKLLNMYNTFYINYSTLYNLKDFSSFSLNLNTKGVFKNYLFSFFEFSYAPYGVIDYYEPHVEGRFYKMPEHIYFNFMLSPDYRKNFLIDFNGGGSKVFHDIERFSVWCGLSPRIRFNNKFLLVLGSNLSFSNNGKGFYDKSEQNEITFGNRTVTTITNTISTSYIFNKKSSLNLRGRHYWSKAEYTQEYTLLNNGNLATNYLQYNRLKDVSFNAFTIDMSYTWNFAPGSEISIVWKNSILKSENGEITSNYFDNFYNTIYSSQLNSFSLKVLYYVDYELLFR